MNDLVLRDGRDQCSYSLSGAYRGLLRMRSTDGHIAGKAYRSDPHGEERRTHDMSSHRNGGQRRVSNHGIAGALKLSAYAPARGRLLIGSSRINLQKRFPPLGATSPCHDGFVTV